MKKLIVSLSLVAMTLGGCAVGEQMKADFNEDPKPNFVRSFKEDSAKLWDAVTFGAGVVKDEAEDVVDDVQDEV